MKKNKKIKFLIPILLFIILLSLRLYFSFQTPFFSDETYQDFVKAEKPFEKGEFLINSIFYNILSFLFLFTKNSFIIKIISNIFFALTGVLIYLIALKICKKKSFSFVAASLSGILPVFFPKTFNNAGHLFFTLFLLFLCTYSYLNSEKRKWLFVYFISFVILSFTNWTVLLLVISLAIYQIINKIEGFEQKKHEFEIFIFSAFFALWAQILLSKKIFLNQGFNILNLNIPSALKQEYFYHLPVSSTMILLGVLPLVLGSYVIYKYLFEKKSKEISLITSFIFTLSILLIFQIAFTEFCLILLGLFLCILISRWLYDFNIFLLSTKAKKIQKIIISTAIILLFLLAVPETIRKTNTELRKNTAEKSIDAILWLKNNSEKNSIILSLPEEGSLIEYFSKRTPAIDSNFLKYPDSEIRLKEVYRIYNTRFETEAVSLTEKYGISYIFFSEKTKNNFNLEAPFYADSECFKKIYSNKADIYMKNPKCKLRVIV
jgi:hypothetical protein